MRNLFDSSPIYKKTGGAFRRTALIVALLFQVSVSIEAQTGTPTITSFTPTSAGTGTFISISGTNFTNVIFVTFGDTPASSYTVWGPTSISAQVGYGATGTVTVITQGGMATSSETFTFSGGSSAPTITSFTPATAGTGTFISISGTNFTDLVDVAFGGTSAASYNVLSPTSISAQVGDGATGTVTVITLGGTATSGGTFTFKPSFLTNLANFSNSSLGASTTEYNGQAFTTGNNAWRLSSVDLSITLNAADAVVKIYSSSAGNMGSEIASLTGTYVSGSIYNFTPASQVTLSANTTYWLVLYSTDNTTFDIADDVAYTGTGTIPVTKRVAFSANAGANWEYYSASDPVLNFSAPFMFALYGDAILPVNWNGSVSTAWNTAANWSGNAVPTSSDWVTIPDVAGDPVVNITDAACSNMTIQSGAVLTIPAGKALTVSGTLTNNSTGGVVLQSDGTGTGSLIMGASAGSGSATAARYMTTDAWHLVAPPLSGQTISGFLAANSNIPEKTGVRGMMDYNPAANVWNSFFTGATAGSLAMGNGYGMRTATSSAVTFTGQPSTGHITLTGLTSDKWNCVGNPYTSALAVNSTTGKELKVFAVKNTGIRIVGMITGNTLATLYDTQGRVVVQRKLVYSDDNIVPTPDLSQGIYLLSLTGGTRPQQFKIQLCE